MLFTVYILIISALLGSDLCLLDKEVKFSVELVCFLLVLSSYLSVCLSVSNITQNVMNRLR